MAKARKRRTVVPALCWTRKDLRRIEAALLTLERVGEALETLLHDLKAEGARRARRRQSTEATDGERTPEGGAT